MLWLLQKLLYSKRNVEDYVSSMMMWICPITIACSFTLLIDFQRSCIQPVDNCARQVREAPEFLIQTSDKSSRIRYVNLLNSYAISWQKIKKCSSKCGFHFFQKTHHLIKLIFMDLEWSRKLPSFKLIRFNIRTFRSPFLIKCRKEVLNIFITFTSTSD